MIKYILFDLDGTLLPMDQEVFVKDYFERLKSGSFYRFLILTGYFCIAFY